MPSTHSSLHYHFVFSTKNRRPYILRDWRERLHNYLGAIIRNIDGIPLETGGVRDHVHLLATLRPVHRVCDVLRELKRSSSSWAHDEIRRRNFGWQEGYCACSVSRSKIPSVIRYIRNQEEHHRQRSFKDEYKDLLEKHGLDFDEKYLW